MASGAAKDAVFKVDNVTGTLTDISAYLTDITFEVEGKVIDATTLGDVFHDYLRGQSDAKIGVEGIFDPLPGTLLYNLSTATSSASWEYYPQGTASGKQKYSGECFLTSYKPPSKLDEAVTFSADFQNTGAVTVANVA